MAEFPSGTRNVYSWVNMRGRMESVPSHMPNICSTKGPEFLVCSEHSDAGMALLSTVVT